MKQLSVIVIACLAGFLGGAVSTRMTRSGTPSPDRVVRATRFELVSKTGNVISMWGEDKTGQIVLAFSDASENPVSPHKAVSSLDEPEGQIGALGLFQDGTPFMTFRSKKDGSPRARLWLNEFEKPTLIMDDASGVRVSLGHEQSDTPNAKDDDWALAFEPERARIGMVSLPGGTERYSQGFLSVHKDKVKFPR